jgi:hypothetical protein
MDFEKVDFTDKGLKKKKPDPSRGVRFFQEKREKR